MSDKEQNRLLHMELISKEFPGIHALTDVNFALDRGEVAALVGENGAGKSTLMKILCGLYQPTKGRIYLDGNEIYFHNPNDAKRAGVLMIHQEISLVQDFTVAENIFLGSLPRKRGLVDWKKLNEEAREQMEKLGYDLDPTVPVRHLSIARQQMIEICRGIALGAKILAFDEPISSLTEKEVEILFANISRLRREGLGIIYISHKMEEIKQISDKIYVLRDGKNSGEFITTRTEMSQIISAMIGRTIENYYYRSERKQGETVLEVVQLSQADTFRDITFQVRAEES